MAGSLGEAVLDLRGDARGLKTDVDSAGNLTESRLQQIGTRMKALGTDLTRSLTLPIVGVGVAAGKMSMDFETAMQHIVGLVGVSQKQVDAWSKELLKLGPEVGKSPKELAEALYFVASSGIETSKAIDVVTAAAKAASAGLGDTQVVADAVSSAMNAYAKSGITAAKATSVLVATVREGKGEAAEIAPALGRVIPIAAQMGISFDQVGAAMAGMTLVGFDAAESATNLSGIMSAFLKPSKQAEDALNAYGLSAAKVRDTIKKDGLLSALNMLRTTVGDNDEALAAIFPNIRGFRGLLSLTGENAEQTEQIFKELAGTTEEDLNNAFNAVTETGAFQFQQAMSQVQGLLIVFGDAVLPVVIPLLKDLTTTVKTLAERFAALPEPVQQTIVVALGLVAALGPLLSIGGNIVTVVGAIAGVLSGPLILAIGAIVAAAIYLAQNWDTIWPQIQGTVETAIATVKGIIEGFVAGAQELWDRFGAQILSIAQSVWTSIQSVVTTVLGAVQSFIAEHGEEIRAFIQSAWERIQMIIGSVLTIIQQTVVPVLQGIAQFISEHGEAIKLVIEGAWNFIRTTVETVLGVIQGILNVIMAAIRGDWNTVWSEIKGIAERIWNGIVALWNTFWTTIGAVLREFAGNAKHEWDMFWFSMKMVVETIWNGIVKFLQDVVNAAIGIINGLIDSFNNTIGKVTGEIPRIKEVAWTTQKELSQAADAMKGNMTDVVGTVISKVKLMMDTVDKNVKQNAPNMFKPITTAADAMNDRISGIVGDLIGMINNLLKKVQNAQSGANTAAAGGTQPGRAIGGPVWPGLSYIVGENRPELFQPEVPGRIIPRVSPGQSGGNVTNYNLTAQYTMQDERSLSDDIRLLQMLG